MSIVFLDALMIERLKQVTSGYGKDCGLKDQGGIPAFRRLGADPIRQRRGILECRKGWGGGELLKGEFILFIMLNKTY